MSRLEAARGLRVSTAEALCATVWMVLTTGAFQTGFALHLGADTVLLGLLAGLPAAVGLLQIPASLWTARLARRKRFVAVSSIVGRLLWIPILLLPWVAGRSAPLLFAILLALSSALLTITVPAWTAWMSDLVPADSRGRYFGYRNMLAGLVAMLVPLPAGWLLDRFEGPSASTGFALLFGASGLAAIAAFVLILRQPETPTVPAPRGAGLGAIAVPLKDRNFRRFLAFACVLVVGQGIGGQFFVMWQVEKTALALPYLAVQLLGAVASAAGLATTQAWGYLSDKYGARPILALAGFVVAIAPFLWIFTEPGKMAWNIPLIVVLSATAGAGWAAVGLTQFNLLIGISRPDLRPTYVAVFSAATGIVGGVAPVVGGAMMKAMESVHLDLGPVELNNFKLIFLLSALLRVVSPLFLVGIDDGTGESTRQVLRRLLSVRSVSTLRHVRQLSAPAGAAQRQEAVEALGGTRATLAVEELTTALDDVAPAVREAAARSLGEIGDPRAIPALGAKLRDPAAGIGETAAGALARIGDPAATPWLVAAIQGPDGGVRIAAMRALGVLRDPSAAPALIDALDPAHQTRTETACAALAALAPKMADEDVQFALPRLLALLSPEVGRGVRLAAAVVWERFAELPLSGVYRPLAARMADESDPAVVARLAAAIGRLGAARADTAGPLCDALERTAGSGLAHTQTLLALADWRLPSGTLYPWLGMDPASRADKLARRMRDLARRPGAPEGIPAIIDRFAESDWRGVLERAADAADDPLLARLARLPEPDAPCAILALLLLEERVARA